MSQLFVFTGLVLFAYLLGSIPFGLALSRMFRSDDPRSAGSGNIGATNALRVGGWKLGLATLFGDMSKGAAPVLLASFLFAASEPTLRYAAMTVCALGAFLGHLYPVYLKCRSGGKGVATAAGCFLVISPPALALALVAFILVAAASRRVSAGSLSAAAVLPAGLFWMGPSAWFTGCALVVSALVIYRHRANIARLLAGTEPPLW